MVSALMKAPAAKARTQASMRLEGGTYRPRAAPKIDEDVVRSPSSETITISPNRSSPVYSTDIAGHDSHTLRNRPLRSPVFQRTQGRYTVRSLKCTVGTNFLPPW